MKKLLYVLIAVAAVVGVAFGLRFYNGHKTNTDKVLVAYFSATGNTKVVAENLSGAIGADLFQIVPEQIYTEEDLDWHNEQSRSSVEMGDKTSRPAIASKIKNMEQYKIVFLGFPIWWGREPSIIDSFMEGYDFSGKTVIPFVTSGSSDIGDTALNLQALAPNATVLMGKRFPNDVSREELKNWADSEMTK